MNYCRARKHQVHSTPYVDPGSERALKRQMRPVDTNSRWLVVLAAFFGVMAGFGSLFVFTVAYATHRSLLRNARGGGPETAQMGYSRTTN